jgi:predicted ATP-dependent serine protease
MRKAGITKRLEIIVDATEALVEDRSLITAMFIAICSAVQDVPIDQSKTVLSDIDLDGSLKQASRVNRRIFRSMDLLTDIILPEESTDKTINRNYHAGIKLIEVENMDALINSMRYLEYDKNE